MTEVRTVPLHPLTTEPKPTPGDGLGFVSLRYRDVPEGFRIGDIVPDSKKAPKTAEMWKQVADSTDLIFSDWEIVGNTIADFKAALQRQYLLNVDTFERLMEVYEDDIAKPILGRTETVTYGDTLVTTTKDTEERETGSSHTDVAIDGSAGNPTYTDKAVTKVNNGEVETTNGHTGTVVTELSDLGVRPNYESLNGFLDNNRTWLEVIKTIFKPCFTLHSTLTW